MVNHHVNGNRETRYWETVMNKILVSIFVGTVLNFAMKITIQLIAIGFHLRTYEGRIGTNKFQIDCLIKLYQFSKERTSLEDSEVEVAPSGLASSPRTPRQALEQGGRVVKEGLGKLGDVAGKVAGKVAADFTGKQVTTRTHPHQVVMSLLASTSGSQVLARRLYRTFAREGCDVLSSNDLKPAFDNDEEAEAAFSMFDKETNGDISMEEFEAACSEVSDERKSITESLKDLDSVVRKLDNVFLFIVIVITILVLISLISTSAAGALTSAGSTILALSWLFSATAQELLQSIIFIFIKHPFDVGDRVTIYGNTGALGKGDDYFVKKIALLYTEFKKMEGHIVQAPNSYLNTLFILNQRRSGGLAEAVPVIIKFGTKLEQIEGLRNILLEFVTSHEQRREYQSKVLTELREITEAHSITLNVVFFYKSNWQNELARLQRRNRFICAMMIALQELDIEGPRMRLPGQKDSIPLYTYDTTPFGDGASHIPHRFLAGSEHRYRDPPFVAPIPTPHTQDASTGKSNGVPLERLPTSALRTISTAGVTRTETLSEMGRRIDLSLGMQDAAFGGDMAGDVYTDRERDSNVGRNRIPFHLQSPSVTRPRRGADRSGEFGSTSQDLGRSTSRATFGSGMLGRIMTDSMDSRMRSTGPVHRNRFFGRGPQRSVDEEQGDGLPIGRVGSANLDVKGSRKQEMQNLARIPEVPGSSGTQSVNPVDKGKKREDDDAENKGDAKIEKLDPRSGLMSPQGWRLNTNDSIQPEPEPGPLSALVPRQQRRDKGKGKDIEMKRLA